MFSVFLWTGSGMKINSIGKVSQSHGSENNYGQNVAFGQIKVPTKQVIGLAESVIEKEFVQPPLVRKDFLSQSLWNTYEQINKNYLKSKNIKIDFSKLGDNLCAIVFPSSHARYEQRLSNLVPTKAEPFFVPLNSDGKELLTSIEGYVKTVEATLPKEAKDDALVTEAIKMSLPNLESVAKAEGQTAAKKASNSTSWLHKALESFSGHTNHQEAKKIPQYA